LETEMAMDSKTDSEMGTDLDLDLEKVKAMDLG
jgi:hypothetical protein